MKKAAKLLLFGQRRVTPITILGSKLVAWWTADRADLITLSSNAVTSWKDVIGGYDAAQAVSASRPVYSATSFNGAPGVTFDGVDDDLTSTDAALLAALPINANPNEMWAIVSQEGLGSDGAGSRWVAAYGGSANTLRALRRSIASSENRATALFGTGAGAVNAQDAGTDFSGRFVMRGEYLATEVALTISGGSRVAAAVTPSTLRTRLRLGAGVSSAATGQWQGQLRDVIMTNAAMTTAEATALNAWALPRRML